MTKIAGVDDKIPRYGKDRLARVMDSSDFEALNEFGSLNVLLRATLVRINQQFHKIRRIKKT